MLNVIVGFGSEDIPILVPEISENIHSNRTSSPSRSNVPSEENCTKINYRQYQDNGIEVKPALFKGSISVAETETKGGRFRST